MFQAKVPVPLTWEFVSANPNGRMLALGALRLRKLVIDVKKAVADIHGDHEPDRILVIWESPD